MFNLGPMSSFNLGQVCPEKKIRSKVTSAAAVLSAIFPSRYCWSRAPSAKIDNRPKKRLSSDGRYHEKEAVAM